IGVRNRLQFLRNIPSFLLRRSRARNVDGEPLMKLQTSCSRRQFLPTVAATGAAIALGPRLGWAADITHPPVSDPRFAEIVAKTIGIDTHNYIDVPLTA